MDQDPPRNQAVPYNHETVEALARDWNNLHRPAIAETTRPVAIANGWLVVEMTRGSEFGARDMRKALDALGRDDVKEVAVRVVDREPRVHDMTPKVVARSMKL